MKRDFFLQFAGDFDDDDWLTMQTEIQVLVTWLSAENLLTTLRYRFTHDVDNDVFDSEETHASEKQTSAKPRERTCW